MAGVQELYEPTVHRRDNWHKTKIEVWCGDGGDEGAKQGRKTRHDTRAAETQSPVKWAKHGRGSEILTVEDGRKPNKGQFREGVGGQTTP